MPTKLMQSVKTLNRTTNKYETEHYYVKCMSLDELNDYIKKANSKKKLIQKCKNEIIRRGK